MRRTDHGTQRTNRPAAPYVCTDGSLMCLGCGYEHNCSIHGCALLRKAVETIENQAAAIEELRGHECSGILEE